MVKLFRQTLVLLTFCPLYLTAQWSNVDSGQELNANQVNSMLVVNDKLLINTALGDEFDGEPYESFLYWDSLTYENAFTGLVGDQNSYSPYCKEMVLWDNNVFLVGTLNDIVFEEEEIIIGVDLESGTPFSLNGGNQSTGRDAVVYHDTLFVVGDLWHIPGLEIEGIELPQTAAWTPDNEWHFVGGAWVGIPQAEVYDDKIVVVGFIDHVVQTDWTSSPSTAVAYYENGVWSPFPGNIAGDVLDVYVDPGNNRLYCIGGNIWIDGEHTSGVIMYDGQQWHKLFLDDPTVHGHVIQHLGIYRGQLYAYMYSPNGSIPDNHRRIMRYDGYDWHFETDFGETTFGIRDMLVYKDELYVCGGNMDSLNGEPLYPQNIAKLYVHPDSVQWGVPEVLPDSGTGISVLEQVNYELKVFPNPNESRFEVSVKNAFTGAILVTDLNGIQLYHQPVENIRRHTVDLGDVAPGTYLLSLVDGGVILGTEKVLVR